MNASTVAAKALNCKVSELQTGESWSGTRYDDGSQDWMTRYWQRGTNRSVVVYTYANDPEPRAGHVEE